MLIRRQESIIPTNHCVFVTIILLLSTAFTLSKQYGSPPTSELSMHIALLEDDPDQSAVMQEWLLHSGHQCDSFDSGVTFIKKVKWNTYDLLILDWLVPDMNGVEVLKWVRENLDWRIPVLFTTQKDSVKKTLCSGYVKGADDYMIKPLKNRELLARIDALGRRSLNSEDTDPILQVEPFRIDRNTRQIHKNNEMITTTNIEFDLALFMFRNYGRVLIQRLYSGKCLGSKC